MANRLSFLLVAAVTLTVSGCSRNCDFEARGVVRDAADGQPIPNVRVEILDSGGRRHTHKAGGPAEATTDGNGEFRVSFFTVPSLDDELTGWAVTLSADGYEPEIIAVGPVKEPNQADVTVYLIFHASLRKAG
ncbi:MAG: carboxypeptidase regulatory-like domain-containing protein [Planctomycetaceae bacterium]|jgi:hypothetical protein|nr:carboxypeptidase regulatory-like domain-containing protein [Planctomycetaceae bacterium]